MPSPNEIPFFFSHVFPWVFTAAGGLFTCRALGTVAKAVASLRWPKLEAKVITSKLGVTDTGGDYPHDLFVPIIEFKYTIDGITKTGDKLAIVGMHPGGKARAEDVLKRYPIGRVLPVYVSPKDRDFAILEPGLRWPLLGKLLGGLFFLTAGIVLGVIFGAFSL
jgi:hypothetical protein